MTEAFEYIIAFILTVIAVLAIFAVEAFIVWVMILVLIKVFYLPIICTFLQAYVGTIVATFFVYWIKQLIK